MRASNPRPSRSASTRRLSPEAAHPHGEHCQTNCQNRALLSGGDAKVRAATRGDAMRANRPADGELARYSASGSHRRDFRRERLSVVRGEGVEPSRPLPARGF